MTALRAQLDAAVAKRIATAQAEAALRGAELKTIESDDGRLEFVLTRHCLTRRFNRLDEVEAWLYSKAAA